MPKTHFDIDHLWVQQQQLGTGKFKKLKIYFIEHRLILYILTPIPLPLVYFKNRFDRFGGILLKLSTLKQNTRDAKYHSTKISKR